MRNGLYFKSCHHCVKHFFLFQYMLRDQICSIYHNHYIFLSFSVVTLHNSIYYQNLPCVNIPEISFRFGFNMPSHMINLLLFGVFSMMLVYVFCLVIVFVFAMVLMIVIRISNRMSLCLFHLVCFI